MNIQLKDQLGRLIKLSSTAKRIVCLVPSITELLWDLGLEAKIVGRTKFCILPEALKNSVPQIGGTKQVHFDKIKNLAPDLIITNKEENTKEIVETLEIEYPVYVSNIQTIHSSLDMILDIGILTDSKVAAEKLVSDIENKRIKWHQKHYDNKTCIYLIWKDPYMTIGKDTFIYTMLQECGFDSIINDYRYPEISSSFIQESNAEYILLSSEPFPFVEKHKEAMEKQFPNKKLLIVDGTYFSWYGSRLLAAYSYFDKILLSL